MSDQIERTLRSLGGQLPGRVSLQGEGGYAAATAIWGKPVGPMPRAVVHCRTTEDVQSSIRTALEHHSFNDNPGNDQQFQRELPPFLDQLKAVTH